MTVSFEKSFGFMFKDERWITKLLIGSLFALLSMVFIGMPFLNGYLIRIVRHRLDHKEGLPDWDNLGKLFTDGLKVWVLNLAYVLPMILAVLCLALPLIVLGWNDDLAPLIVLIFMPIQGLMFLYSLFIILLHPWIYYTVASDAPLSQAFQLRTYFKIIKQDWSNALIALLFVWLAGAISGLGFFLFFIGIFIGMAYVTMVTGDIYGRLLASWRSSHWLT